MKLDRDGTEIEEPDDWTDEDRKRHRELIGADLPDIIDRPGWYKTRSGLRVRIDRIGPKNKATFNCAGTLFLQERTPSKPARTEWTIWKQSGRWGGLGENPKDIVSKA